MAAPIARHYKPRTTTTYDEANVSLNQLVYERVECPDGLMRKFHRNHPNALIAEKMLGYVLAANGRTKIRGYAVRTSNPNTYVFLPFPNNESMLYHGIFDPNSEGVTKLDVDPVSKSTRAYTPRKLTKKSNPFAVTKAERHALFSAQSVEETSEWKPRPNCAAKVHCQRTGRCVGGCKDSRG